MISTKWLLCPICSNKTRIKARSGTIMKKYDINYTDGEPIDVTFHVTYNANGGIGSYTGPAIKFTINGDIMLYAQWTADDKPSCEAFCNKFCREYCSEFCRKFSKVCCGVCCKKELERGYSDFIQGKTKPAAQVFSDIHKDYDL